MLFKVFLKRIWLVLAGLVIAIAILSSIFRALTPWAKQYKSEVEQHLSTLIGQPVTISTMETGWYWFEPVIKLKQLSVTNRAGDLIQLNKLLVGINLFQSLRHWQIQPGILYLDGIKLTLRQQDNHWAIDGFGKADAPNMSYDEKSFSPVLAWILSQQKIIIKDLSANVYWQDGHQMAVKKFNMGVAQQGGRYHFSGLAFLEQTPATSFRLIADLALDPQALKKARGEVYLSVSKANIQQWHPFLPDGRFAIASGVGDIKLWLGIKSGRIASAQSLVNLKKLVIRDSKTHSDYSLPKLRANLALTVSSSGWQLSADNIALQTANIRWPRNQFSIQYQQASDMFHIYVQHLLPQSLKAANAVLTDLTTPALAGALNILLPQGRLDDTQVTLQKGLPVDVLSHFTGLGWQATDGKPGVDNISGVIHWSSDGGRLDLDSQQLRLKPVNMPILNLPVVNGSVIWKKTTQGYRLAVERLVVEHPDMILTSTMAVNDLSHDKAGQIDLSAQLSLKNIPYWLSFIPSGYLKPKLENWLKQDITQGDSITAEVSLHGMAADFPFDKTPGEFLIKGYAHGIKLAFAPGWPKAESIDAWYTLDKRQFEASIVGADVQGVPMTNGNLRITDLGLNHENLLLHTLVTMPAEKALVWINATPLRDKLKSLDMLKVKGPIDVDLNIEAPLYPENDDILALGDIRFHDNTVDVSHDVGSLQLNDLSGILHFNHTGILQSSLTALFMDAPVRLLLQSVNQPVPSTEINVQGKIEMESLQRKLNLPVFSLLHGAFNLSAILSIADKPDNLDHIRFNSSLQGLAIDLPAPAGKAAETEAPLKVEINLGSDKDVQLMINYADKVTSQLWLTNKKGQVVLKKGGIYVNSKLPATELNKGVQLAGNIEKFDVNEWSKVVAKLSPTSDTRTLKDAIDKIDFKFGQLLFANRSWKNVSIKAFKRIGDLWFVEVNQAQINGQFNYNPQTHTLKGRFSRWYMETAGSTLVKKQDESFLSSFKFQDMPALDLDFDSLHYGDLDLGQAKIKATAQPTVWRLDQFSLVTPVYQLTANGQWTQDKNVNTSSIDANMTIKNLAQTLSSWKITPVVEAGKGTVLFRGGWPGGFQDFSLAKVSGQASITFKNGRITHLSKETEEKLGLGKLLSVLSLQTIPRRLKLDFSDLSHQGYSFDTFRGNFSLANGQMSTKDSYIDGPIAYASMKGSLDIARQLYDVDLKISPHVTASLPVVATIAGGPIAGLATWIASKIINRGMQEVSGYTYKISGPWKQPVVQQVSIIRKRK